MTRQEINRLAVIDLIYGLGAVALVAAGMMLWFAVGKPADFYTNNWIFLLKVGLAIGMGLISLIPTIFFLKNRKGEDEQELVNIPGHLIMIVRIELLLLLLIPFCAVLMAKGIGFSA